MPQRPRISRQITHKKPKKHYQHLQQTQDNYQQTINDHQEYNSASLEQLLSLDNNELGSKVRAGLQYLLYEQKNPSIQAKRFFSLSHYLAKNDEYTVSLQFKKQPKVNNQDANIDW